MSDSVVVAMWIACDVWRRALCSGEVGFKNLASMTMSGCSKRADLKRKTMSGCSKSVDVIVKRKTSKSADVDVMKRKTSKSVDVGCYEEED